MVVRHVGYRNSKEYKGYVVVTGNRMRIWRLKCLSRGGVASNWFEGSQSWEENQLSSQEREQERKYDLRWNYSLRIFWERINFASPKLPDFKVADKRDLPIARCLRGLGVFKGEAANCLYPREGKLPGYSKHCRIIVVFHIQTSDLPIESTYNPNTFSWSLHFSRTEFRSRVSSLW